MQLEKLLWLRKYARIVMFFGLTVSVTGNVLHVLEYPTITRIGISLAAPVFFFISFELVTRVPMRPGPWYKRIWRAAATCLIAGGTAFLSFGHQHAAILRESTLPGTVPGFWEHAQAIVLPVAVDGMMVVASVTLVELGYLIAMAMARATATTVKTASLDKDKPVEPKPERFGKKERIVRVWQELPDLSIDEIAKRAGASYNYAHAVVTKLRGQEDLVAA